MFLPPWPDWIRCAPMAPGDWWFDGPQWQSEFYGTYRWNVGHWFVDPTWWIYIIVEDYKPFGLYREAGWGINCGLFNAVPLPPGSLFLDYQFPSPWYTFFGGVSSFRGVGYADLPANFCTGQ